MKVYISKYKNWNSPHDLYMWLQSIGISEKRADKISDWISDYTPWFKITGMIHEWRCRNGVRKARVSISSDDIWSGDSTLAYVLIPFLKEFKKNTHGFPNDDNIKSMEDWYAIIDKMIWSFENILNDDWEDQFYDMPSDRDFMGVDCGIAYVKDIRYDKKGYTEYSNRIQEGCELFGKYFQNLWI